MQKDQVLYVGQKAFIEKDGEVLILLRSNGWLDFPGGKIQEGESDVDVSLKREVREETGLDIEIGQPFHRWLVELPSGHQEAGKRVFLIGIKCTYAGGEVKTSNEHQGYAWVNKDTYKKFGDGSGHFKALEVYFQAS